MYKIVGIPGAKEIERALHKELPSTTPVVIVIGPIKKLLRTDKSFENVLKIKKTLQKTAAGGLYVHLAPENQDLTGTYPRKIHTVGTGGERFNRKGKLSEIIVINKGGFSEKILGVKNYPVFGNNRFIADYSVVKAYGTDVDSASYIYENLLTITDFKEEEVAFKTTAYIGKSLEVPKLDFRNKIPVIGFLSSVGNHRTAIINADVEKINLETIKELLLCIK